MFIAISLLLVLACIVPASAKLAGAPSVRESAAHVGIPWNRYRLSAGTRPGSPLPHAWMRHREIAAD